MARSAHSQTLRILLWCGVLGIFVGYLVWALRTEEMFRVVRKQLEHTAAGVIVSGEIYNAATSAATVNVEVTFFDQQGHQLTQETVTLHNLNAGATLPFHTQPQQLPTVGAYTIYVNTGRNMYGN